MALDISAAKVVKILHVCKFFFWILGMGYGIMGMGYGYGYGVWVWGMGKKKKERDITSNSFSIMKNTIY